MKPTLWDELPESTPILGNLQIIFQGCFSELKAVPRYCILHEASNTYAPWIKHGSIVLALCSSGLMIGSSPKYQTLHRFSTCFCAQAWYPTWTWDQSPASSTASAWVTEQNSTRCDLFPRSGRKRDPCIPGRCSMKYRTLRRGNLRSPDRMSVAVS